MQHGQNIIQRDVVMAGPGERSFALLRMTGGIRMTGGESDQGGDDAVGDEETGLGDADKPIRQADKISA